MSTHPHRIRELLAHPSAAGLAYALRHPETWPDGFRWDFGTLDYCAMGLAAAMWPKAIRIPATDVVGPLLGMTEGEARSIFIYTLDRLPWWDIWTVFIRPRHVAAAIEQWMERQGPQ